MYQNLVNEQVCQCCAVALKPADLLHKERK